MNNVIFELVEKNKKNSRLSSSDRECFESELLSELLKEAYTEDIEGVLCEGPSDLTMKVLAMYLTSIDINDANEFLKKYISCTKIQENKGGTAGIRLVWLFTALVDCDKGNNPVIERVFLSLVWFAYKNGKEETNKKVVDLIKTCIFPLFTNRDSILDLHFIDKEKVWIRTRNLFVEAVLNNEKKPYDLVKKVFYWLKSSERTMGKYTEEYLTKIMVEQTSDKSKEKIVLEKEENIISETRIVKEAQVGETKGLKSDYSKDIRTDNSEEREIQDTIEALGTIASVLLIETKEIANIKSDLDYTRRKVDEMQVQLNKSQVLQQQQETTIKSLFIEKKSLQDENSSYAVQISKLEKIIEKLKGEINDREKFTDTVTRNREKQSEEYLNRLASKLKIDYRDYCDAKDLEMTIDLGENMREQLGAVFSILEKNGLRLS
jgi:hypothetical protein